MKAEFSNPEQLEEWLRNVVSAGKYDLYYETLERRLYAIKNVSTEPRLHGYVDGVDIEEAQSVVDSTGRNVLTTVKTFEWEHDSTEATVGD